MFERMVCIAECTAYIDGKLVQHVANEMIKIERNISINDAQMQSRKCIALRLFHTELISWDH